MFLQNGGKIQTANFPNFNNFREKFKLDVQGMARGPGMG